MLLMQQHIESSWALIAQKVADEFSQISAYHGQHHSFSQL